MNFTYLLRHYKLFRACALFRCLCKTKINTKKFKVLCTLFFLLYFGLYYFIFIDIHLSDLINFALMDGVILAITLYCRCSFKNTSLAYYRETRMTTSISSEAQSNQSSILIRGRENHVSP